ncbi:MAG: protein,cache protein [Acidobacteria bacterium]|nr:protein,cache protein [Acidobacteriota bacterium]
MRIRTRLSLAFFLISVVPIGLVTAYSYYSSAAALRRAVEGQADQMAAEMGDRMAWVMTDLGDRVERLWRMRVESAPAAPQEPVAAPDEKAVAELRTVATAMLAEAAPLVRRLEFESSAGSAGGTASPAPEPAPPPEPGFGPRGGDYRRGPAGGRPPAGEPGGAYPPGQRGLRTGVGPPGRPGGPPVPGVPVLAPGMPRIVIDMPSSRAAAASGQAQAALESLSPEAIFAWRRAIQRQAEREADLRALAPAVPPPGAPQPPGAPVVPRTGSAASAPAPPGRPGRSAVTAAAAKAEQERRRAERSERMLALARGDALQFPVTRDGRRIGAISATVDRDRMIETVLSIGRRERGEIPFVLDAGGGLHTVDPEAARTVSALKLDVTARTALESSSTQLAGDWIVVTKRDPSGIVFGLARPIRDSLREMRRASLRNLAMGLLLIAGAFTIILPLASRLTRHLSALNAGVQRLAAGDRAARVHLETGDEVGELARSFNRMASELEAHDLLLAKQERLARELELCRQIQNEMLPHGPLKLGLAEIAGVSIPAREVGGDFFNYFPLADGRIAVLVGDVSGKGVGAALLMANIQATLRARLQLESDLAQLADSVDHDIAANTPPEVYITLFVGLLDPPRRELRYVNAGHNPQFLLRADGGIERLDSTGLPIGLLPGHGFEARTVAVEPGDLLFLYTDGAVEAPNEKGEFFDADRLQQALVAASAEGIDEILVSVERAVRAFRGEADPADDATMLALRLGKRPSSAVS